MTISLKVRPEELNLAFLEHLRALLGEQQVEFVYVRSVDPNGHAPDADADTGYPNGAHYADDTEYLNANPANRAFLDNQIRKLNDGSATFVSFTSEEFDAFVAQKLAE